MEKKNGKLRNMTLIGLMTAVLSVVGPLSLPLPISPVPVSLTNLAIYLTLYVLGWKRTMVSYAVYLLLGIVGVPVFSGWSGVVGKLLGPTGGYLVGFFLMILIAGIVVERAGEHSVLCLLGLVAGMAVCNLFGTFWLAYQAHMTFLEALAAGVIAFLPADLAKCLLAVLLGGRLRGALKRASLI